MTIDDTLKKLWPEILDRFNYPQIDEPSITDDPEINTACFIWKSKKTLINRKFATDLAQRMGEEAAIYALLQHEIGHYAEFPRELSDRIYLYSHAEAYFGNKADAIYGFYSDMIDELRTLRFGTEDLLKLRETMIPMAEELHDAASATINRLLTASYTTIIPTYASRAPTLSDDEKRMHKDILTLRLLSRNMQDHCANLHIFGETIKHLIKEKPGNGGGQGKGGQGEGKEGQGNNNGTGNDAKPMLSGKLGASAHDIDVALDDILKKYGPHAFRTAKKFLGQTLKEYEDKKSLQAGHESGDLTYNDDLVPFYSRWARGFGLNIVKRPYESDATALHPGDLKEYEVGDPTNKIDIIASRGILCVPTITKIRRDEEENMPMLDFRIPDANIGIDSSGSMTSPRHDSIAVLAATILGRNYHANGALVGGWNFSTDIEFVPPSRDLNAFLRLMCAYYGGGTQLNVQKVEEYLKKMNLNGTDIVRYKGKEIDYQSTAEHLPDQKQFMDKSLNVKTPELRKKLERLDNILITDGGIGNAEEVVHHLNNLAKVTRNIVFITDKGGYAEWKPLESANTFVYPAYTKEDLLRLAIGRAKRIA